MARILFYTPFNQRSRDTESLMLAFNKQGHKVIFLSQQEGNLINDFLNANGVTAVSYVISGRRSGRWYYCRHLFFFVSFCWKHNIQVVYSHLEPSNFVAAIGQYLIRANTYLCRHHSDQYRLLNRDRDWSYRLTYWLARHIIVFSERTGDHMIQEEGIPANRIIRINLAYDFSLYPEVRPSQVETLKQKYKAEMLLIAVGSFLPLKRPGVCINVVKLLRNAGIDAKLILLGKGELESSLKALTQKLELDGHIFFPGYVQNVLEYMAASTFVLHPSISEASCVSIKEAGLVRRPVIVCRGVGDFDDYILNAENGFLANKDNFDAEASNIIQRYLSDKSDLVRIGENLRASVVQRFGIASILPYYDTINRQN